MAPTVPLTLTELERRLVAADPSVVLAPAAVLRRVIRHDRGFLGLPLKVPHHKTYVVASRTLLQVATREELGLDLVRGLPERVTLLVAPSAEHLEDTASEAVLLEYWRLLFHARIHVALEDRWAKGELTLQSIQSWVAKIGEAKVREALAVLSFEHLLLPPDDHKNQFIEFAAVFLELAYFADTLLPSYFPSLRDATNVQETLERETGGRELYLSTRPDGAPEPSPPAETASEEPLAFYRSLVKDADEASRHANYVRAAILRTRAARVAPAAEEEPTRERARTSLQALVDRLLGILRADDAVAANDAVRWRNTLDELLDKSDQGIWPQEARLLHDLQKACFYGEREVYKVSVIRWVLAAT
jgi:hypothetical protein